MIAVGSDTILLAAAWFVVFVFSTTLHEAAHAAAALKLGDPTAYRGGQVSLNPVPHIRREPFGMIVVPILSFMLSGWMLGWASAPYDPRWAHRAPRRAALMALAGPLSNFALVLASAVAIRLGMLIGLFEAPQFLSFAHMVEATAGGPATGLATLLSVLFSLNLILGVFNLLPLPPMDGSSVIQLAMSDDRARAFQSILRQPMFGWVGILIAWRIFGSVFGPIHGFAVSLLYPSLSYG